MRIYQKPPGPKYYPTADMVWMVNNQTRERFLAQLWKSTKGTDDPTWVLVPDLEFTPNTMASLVVPDKAGSTGLLMKGLKCQSCERVFDEEETGVPCPACGGKLSAQ